MVAVVDHLRCTREAVRTRGRNTLSCRPKQATEVDPGPLFILCGHQLRTDDSLTRFETGNRPHACNANFGYESPFYVQGNKFMKQLTPGWRFKGTAEIFCGANIALICGFPSNPSGYSNGTPTVSVRYRCRRMTATPLCCRFHCRSQALVPRR